MASKHPSTSYGEPAVEPEPNVAATEDAIRTLAIKNFKKRLEEMIQNARVTEVPEDHSEELMAQTEALWHAASDWDCLVLAHRSFIEGKIHYWPCQYAPLYPESANLVDDFHFMHDPDEIHRERNIIPSIQTNVFAVLGKEDYWHVTQMKRADTEEQLESTEWIWNTHLAVKPSGMAEVYLDGEDPFTGALAADPLMIEISTQSWDAVWTDLMAVVRGAIQKSGLQPVFRDG
ncbi:hypothetical protein BU23DRAFT_598280 [Bimuria novae-zelandiae CBS 107.79]|uniref:Uncharacterized protein n=1 Tax=Bimuria novae-zelandiae CBS 107.79 TaxID=1447943 RepID=A0A6A5VE08_9PLEO|nr:hypothetical protein BU23DRAFT_598280 [Bimuria novae-zelandiae CBS 107.79]